MIRTFLAVVLVSCSITSNAAESVDERLDRIEQRLSRIESLLSAEPTQTTAPDNNGEQSTIVLEHRAIIMDTIAGFWTQPPLVKMESRIVVNIKLVPTGEVISSRLVTGSSDERFDQSVLEAIKQAGRFPDLRDLPNAVFEANFRNLDLSIRADDLIQ